MQAITKYFILSFFLLILFCHLYSYLNNLKNIKALFSFFSFAVLIKYRTNETIIENYEYYISFYLINIATEFFWNIKFQFLYIFYLRVNKLKIKKKKLS